MKSILFLIETIYSNISRCNYLRKAKYFLNFFFHFRNLDSIWYIFKKKMALIADVFLNFRTRRDVVRCMSKKSLFREHLDKLYRNWPKHCSKLNNSMVTTFIYPCVHAPKHSSKRHDTTITIVIDPCEWNWGWKSLSGLYPKSSECLLIHWLPMTSILFLTETIYCNIFRSNYLRIKNLFLDVSCFVLFLFFCIS